MTLPYGLELPMHGNGYKQNDFHWSVLEITVTNQDRRKERNEPIKTRSICLIGKSGASLTNQSQSVAKVNRNKNQTNKQKPTANYFPH